MVVLVARAVDGEFVLSSVVLEANQGDEVERRLLVRFETEFGGVGQLEHSTNRLRRVNLLEPLRDAEVVQKLTSRYEAAVGRPLAQTARCFPKSANGWGEHLEHLRVAVRLPLPKPALRLESVFLLEIGQVGQIEAKFFAQRLNADVSSVYQFAAPLEHLAAAKQVVAAKHAPTHSRGRFIERGPHPRLIQAMRGDQTCRSRAHNGYPVFGLDLPRGSSCAHSGQTQHGGSREHLTAAQCIGRLEVRFNSLTPDLAG